MRTSCEWNSAEVHGHDLFSRSGSDVTVHHPEHRCKGVVTIAAENHNPTKVQEQNHPQGLDRWAQARHRVCGRSTRNHRVHCRCWYLSQLLLVESRAHTLDRTPVPHRSHTPLTGVIGIFVLIYYKMYYSRKANGKTFIYFLYHDMNQNKDMKTQSQTSLIHDRKLGLSHLTHPSHPQHRRSLPTNHYSTSELPLSNWQYGGLCGGQSLSHTHKHTLAPQRGSMGVLRTCHTVNIY